MARRPRGVRVGLAEVVEHQRAGPDRADRVGDALAGDVGRRAVDRLEHRRVLARRVEVARRAPRRGCPSTAAPRSVRMSPNRFDATITSSVCGWVTMRAASASTWYLRDGHGGDSRGHLVDDLVPQHHRVLQRVRLGGAGQEPARPRHAPARTRSAPRRSMPRRVKSPVCSATSCGVPRCRRPPRPAYSPSEFSRTQTMSMSAGPRSRERRRDAGQQPHRPQVHVLLEPLPDRQDEFPHRDVIGHRGRADGAEVDGVEAPRAGRGRRPASSAPRPGSTRSPTGSAGGGSAKP